MDCIVLAAGEGKRMRPLTANRPKVMLPIANRPMLEHLVIAAREAGIRDFIFVVGYGEREIRSYFKNGESLGITIRYVTQRRQLGTSDALKSAAGLVRGPFLMLNGDMILRSEDIRALAASTGPCMATFQSAHPEDYGVVTVKGNRITGLEEKAPKPKSTLINAGAYVFPPVIFDRLTSVGVSRRGEFELTDALEEWIEKRELGAYTLGAWLDVGHPWDLLDANATLLGQQEPVQEGTVEPNVVLRGNVSIGKETVVKSGTYIEGPVSIGQECRIGPHAYIRASSSIGNHCHIGTAEVKNSIVMAQTNIPHFNYVGDSIIGSKCNLGAGTSIANLRHDHKPIKVCGQSSGKVKF
ncbi:MAG: NTP transferase domain-containing protein, partial [Methanomicrobiales archaeon]|nr:NTP transferase domain-containing protein [Methanomicrobiales archaeon]